MWIQCAGLGLVVGGLWLSACGSLQPPSPSATADTTATPPVPEAVITSAATDAAPDRVDHLLPPIGPDPSGAMVELDVREVGPYIVRTWAMAGQEHPNPEWPTAISVTVGTRDAVLALIPNGIVADETGSDVNGTGSADIVIHEIRSGNACCQRTQVFDTVPELHPVLATPLDATCGQGLRGAFADLNADGAKEFVTCAAGDYEVDGCLYFWEMGATEPKAILAYDADQGAYVPAGPRFSSAYEPDIAAARDHLAALTPEESSTCPAVNLALTYLFAGRADEAWTSLRMFGGPKAEELQALLETGLAADPLYVEAGGAAEPVLEGVGP